MVLDAFQTIKYFSKSEFWNPAGWNKDNRPLCKDTTNIRRKYKCKTEDGKDCVFPFIYKGELYNSCVRTGHGRKWCSTSKDPSGKHISGAWGNCGYCSPTAEVNC